MAKTSENTDKQKGKKIEVEKKLNEELAQEEAPQEEVGQEAPDQLPDDGTKSQ